MRDNRRMHLLLLMVRVMRLLERMRLLTQVAMIAITGIV